MNNESIGTQPNEFIARPEDPALGRRGYLVNRRKRRELRRRVESLVGLLSDDEMNDWALVYAFRQLHRYRTLTNRYAVLYRSVEAIALLLASIVTVLAALNARPWVTASIAALVTFLTGFRQINLLDQNWISCADASIQLDSLVSKYRVLPATDHSNDKRQQLVEETDKVIAARIRIWKRELQLTASQREGPSSDKL
jgi:hypothetical protein